MATPTVVYISNTNVLELQGLYSAIEVSYVNDATVTVTVKDSSGTSVTGQTWPLTMTYVAASNGNYRAILVDDLSLQDNQPYSAYINANAGTNRIGHWEFPFTARVRTK